MNARPRPIRPAKLIVRAPSPDRSFVMQELTNSAWRACTLPMPQVQADAHVRIALKSGRRVRLVSA